MELGFQGMGVYTHVLKALYAEEQNWGKEEVKSKSMEHCKGGP